MRRICLVGAAFAGSLVVGVSVAPAANKAPKVKPTKVSCKIAMSVAIPSGDTQLALPADGGNMYGTAACGRPLGHGIVATTFTLQDSGDLTGKFAQYYSDGTVHGTFDLTPTDSSPSSPGSFMTQSYTGTGAVQGGSGTDAGDSGPVKMKCTTPDSVHLTCTETIKLTLK
jgi:hypothetical protein